MSKYGEVITKKKIVVCCFGIGDDEEFKDQCKRIGELEHEDLSIISIDVTKNETLCEALRIKSRITYIFYKNGEMFYRTGSGVIEILKKQLTKVLKED